MGRRGADSECPGLSLWVAKGIAEKSLLVYKAIPTASGMSGESCELEPPGNLGYQDFDFACP